MSKLCHLGWQAQTSHSKPAWLLSLSQRLKTVGSVLVKSMESSPLTSYGEAALVLIVLVNISAINRLVCPHLSKYVLGV